jgi:hypothetical protein
VRIRGSYFQFLFYLQIPEYGDIYSKILLQYFARKMTQVIFNNLNQPAILHYVFSFNHFTKVTRAKVIPDTRWENRSSPYKLVFMISLPHLLSVLIYTLIENSFTSFARLPIIT